MKMASAVGKVDRVYIPWTGEGVRSQLVVMSSQLSPPTLAQTFYQTLATPILSHKFSTVYVHFLHCILFIFFSNVISFFNIFKFFTLILKIV